MGTALAVSSVADDGPIKLERDREGDARVECVAKEAELL